LLQWAAYGAGLVACEGSSDETDGSNGTTAGAEGSRNGIVPEETAGPYPEDGTSNGGTNALSLEGIVRSDVRSSVGGATGTAGGVPLTVRLTIQDAGCTPLAGYAVYIWHCDREGRYSMYSAGATAENHLRGVQLTDDAGVVEFLTIFPAWEERVEQRALGRAGRRKARFSIHPRSISCGRSTRGARR
jgi:protocatechuate 3,4-dioxygenase beta subunit